MPVRQPADEATRVEDLRDLRAFTLASDLRSLAKAALALGESKATVSRRIRRIEASLGTALVRRSSRGVTLTDHGASYLERVREVFALLGDANTAAMAGGDAEPSGELRVSVPPGFGSALAPVFAGFCGRFPAVVLVVHVASRFVDLERERFDVAVRAAPRLSDSSLVAVKVRGLQAEGIVVASPGYLRVHRAPRTPSDLARHRVVGLGDSGADYIVPLVARRGGDVIELTLPVAVVGSDIGFVKEMVASGAGISVVPRLAVQRELREGTLVHLLSDYAWKSVELFLVHRGGRFVAPKVRAFLDWMKSALEATPG